MATMKDSNGVEMTTGMVVEIKNAYFKNDNGLWFIDNTPGDANWCGSDYSLHKLCKNGKVSTARHHIAFWPLCSFCSDRSKNYAANEHNKEHATITVRTDIPTGGICEHFAEKAEGAKATLEWDTRRGHSPKVLDQERAIVKHYENLVKKTAPAE